MGLVGSTLEDLGKPRRDGTPAVVRVGTFPDMLQEQFTWTASARGGQGAWIGRPHSLMQQTNDQFFVVSQMEWGYFVDASGAGSAGDPGKTWFVRPILFAGEMYAAGFRLQMLHRGIGQGTGISGSNLRVQVAPWFYEYGTSLSVDNKLSLNNDSRSAPYPLLPGNFDAASSGPSVSLVGMTLPGTIGITSAGDTRTAFTLSATAAIPNGPTPNAGPGNFVNNPASIYYTPTSGEYLLSIEHPTLDRPIRLSYTGISGSNFTGCTVAYDTNVGVSAQTNQAKKINGRTIPAGAIALQARLAGYPPSGNNPNGVASWSDNPVASGPGAIGYGPPWTSVDGVFGFANAKEFSTGWQDINSTGNPAPGEGAFFRAFASGALDLSRPCVPTQHILYPTYYARIKGVPNGMLAAAAGQGRAIVEGRYRWVGYP